MLRSLNNGLLKYFRVYSDLLEPSFLFLGIKAWSTFQLTLYYWFSQRNMLSFKTRFVRRFNLNMNTL